MRKAGFEVMGDDACPICPVVLKDSQLGKVIEAELLRNGLYTILIYYPVIPLGEARMRMIVTLKHTEKMIDDAIAIFKKVAKENNFFERVDAQVKKQKKQFKSYYLKMWLKSWFVPLTDLE